MSETLYIGHVGHHPAAEWSAMLAIEHLQHAGADGRHVYVGRAFAMTPFACEAAVEHLFKGFGFGGVGVVWQSACERFAQDVGAGTGGEEFVVGKFEGWAHGATDEGALAAVAGAVALLDGAHEVGVRTGILLVDVVAQALVHGRCVDNFVHVEHSVRVPALLYLSHEFIDRLPVDHGYEFAAEAAVAVFAAEASTVFANQQGCLFRHLAEKLAVMLLLDV